jgi:hypothetical protein
MLYFSCFAVIDTLPKCLALFEDDQALLDLAYFLWTNTGSYSPFPMSKACPSSAPMEKNLAISHLRKSAVHFFSSVRNGSGGGTGDSLHIPGPAAHSGSACATGAESTDSIAKAARIDVRIMACTLAGFPQTAA